MSKEYILKKCKNPTTLYIVGDYSNVSNKTVSLNDDFTNLEIINPKDKIDMETIGSFSIYEANKLQELIQGLKETDSDDPEYRYFDIYKIINYTGNIILQHLDKKGKNLLHSKSVLDDDFLVGSSGSRHFKLIFDNECEFIDYSEATIETLENDNNQPIVSPAPKESIELSPEKFDKLIDKFKEQGAEVIISDEKFDLDSLNITKEVKKPLDISTIPDRIKISQLLSNSTEGFNLTENGSVLNLFAEEEISNLTVLDIDIDLSDKFNVLYLFRFKSIEFNTKQHKDITHITVDSQVFNLDNINIDSVYAFEQRSPLDNINEALEILSKFKNLKNSKFYVNDLDFEQMYEFYATKPKNSFLFHPEPENVINRLSNQYKHDKNIDNLLLKLNQIIIFGS